MSLLTVAEVFLSGVHATIPLGIQENDQDAFKAIIISSDVGHRDLYLDAVAIPSKIVLLWRMFNDEIMAAKRYQAAMRMLESQSIPRDSTRLIAVPVCQLAYEQMLYVFTVTETAEEEVVYCFVSLHECQTTTFSSPVGGFNASSAA